MTLGNREDKAYWKMREEALDRTLWRTRFGSDYGHAATRTT